MYLQVQVLILIHESTPQSTFSVSSNIFITLVSTELDKSVHQPCIWHYHQHCTVNMLFQLLSQSRLVINGTVIIIVANHVY